MECVKYVDLNINKKGRLIVRLIFRKYFFILNKYSNANYIA